MVDNRAAGFYGVGGSFNFKSGDISGTAANLQDDKMGQGSEYMRLEKQDEESETKYVTEPFTDRSAQLRATLNSLAMMNITKVIPQKKTSASVENKNEDDEEEKETLKKPLLIKNKKQDEE